MEKIPITKAGFEKLKKDLETLKNISIPENVRDIESCKSTWRSIRKRGICRSEGTSILSSRKIAGIGKQSSILQYHTANRNQGRQNCFRLFCHHRGQRQRRRNQISTGGTIRIGHQPEKNFRHITARKSFDWKANRQRNHRQSTRRNKKFSNHRYIH